MKSKIKIGYKYLLILLLSLTLFACKKNLTETNANPNVLAAGDIDPSFVLTQIISGSAAINTKMMYGGSVSNAMLAEAMQYTQRDYLEYQVTNTFLWFPLSWSEQIQFYSPLTNANYLQSRSVGSVDEPFLTGVALIMKSFWFGYLVSAWGDIPYSEALQGDKGILQPVYDKQQDVFKGILADLEKANNLLTNATVGSVNQSADILFQGNTLQWRQFANSLHLRFLMRLSEKTSDMQSIGVDVKAEFAKIVSDPNTYPVIKNSNDNAAVVFPGTNLNDSWPGGNNNWVDRSEFYRRKSGATIVHFLESTLDPRLTVWIKPVDVQSLVRDKGAEKVVQLDSDGKVRRYFKTYQAGLDTSLYVGLGIALQNPDSYNLENSADFNAVKALDPSIYNGSASNPFVSYLGDMFAQNSGPYLKSVFISAAEVDFLIAEAITKSWISGSSVDYYKQGIEASLNQYGIADGDEKVYNPTTHTIEPFNLSSFLSAAGNIFNNATNKLEPIMTQSWAANFLNAEGWFNWRRTGLPDLGLNVIAGGNGQKIPVRFGYGTDQQITNGVNYKAALQSLDPAVDDQWSKMWLLQGTGEPW